MGLEPPSTPNNPAKNKPVHAESLPAFLGPIAGAGGEKSGDVEAALAFALTEATAAGRWDLVAQIANELQARRTAPAGNVVALPKRRGQK